MASMRSPDFSGNQQDFGSVISKYSPVLYRTALRRLRNPADAEDAVQDALLSAYKHMDQFAGRARMTTWLSRIAINAAGMQLRKRPRYEAVSLDESLSDGSAPRGDFFADKRPNPEQVFRDAELHTRLHDAMDRLAPILSEAVQLCEFEGLSMCDAARRIGVTTNTMKSRVRRARIKLGILLQPHVGRAKTSAAKRSKVKRSGAASRVLSYRKRSKILKTREPFVCAPQSIHDGAEMQTARELELQTVA